MKNDTKKDTTSLIEIKPSPENLNVVPVPEQPCQCSPPEARLKSTEHFLADIYDLLCEGFQLFKAQSRPVAEEKPPLTAPVTLSLGLGEIGMTDMTSLEQGSIPTLIFHPIKRQALGPIELPSSANDPLVIVTCANGQGVQGVIDWLVWFKANHFPESNPLAAG